MIKTQVIMNTIWVLVTAKLVFFMNPGFAILETVFTRAKNSVNILSKNFIVFAVTSLAFLAVGWGLMFGEGNALIIGLKGIWFVSGTDNSPAIGNAYKGVYSSTAWSAVPLWAKVFFQLTFCGTAATIVSGAVAERIKYHTFILFSIAMSTLIYPIVGHWVWGGGWLAKKGMFDFAGSTVVHSVGGWAALAGILLLGPRFGKYGKKVNSIPGHNLPLATMGTFILWFGWFGFNPGSTMMADPMTISHIAVTTNTSAASAIISSTVISYLIFNKWDLGMVLNGCLAGLVAITAGCAFVSISSSIIIGIIAGIIVVLAVICFDRVRIDDPVGALSVHLINGIWGTLSVGLFAQDKITGTSTENGLFYGGGVKLLLEQLYGVVASGTYTFLISLFVWMILRATVGIRVSLEEEIEGLDIGEHGNIAYPEFANTRTSPYLLVG